jgi:hypothetical protein
MRVHERAWPGAPEAGSVWHITQDYGPLRRSLGEVSQQQIF